MDMRYVFTPQLPIFHFFDMKFFCFLIFATSWAGISSELTKKKFPGSRHEIPCNFLIKLSLLHGHVIY